MPPRDAADVRPPSPLRAVAAYLGASAGVSEGRPDADRMLAAAALSAAATIAADAVAALKRGGALEPAAKVRAAAAQLARVAIDLRSAARAAADAAPASSGALPPEVERAAIAAGRADRRARIAPAALTLPTPGTGGDDE